MANMFSMSDVIRMEFPPVEVMMCSLMNDVALQHAKMVADACDLNYRPRLSITGRLGVLTLNLERVWFSESNGFLVTRGDLIGVEVNGYASERLTLSPERVFRVVAAAMRDLSPTPLVGGENLSDEEIYHVPGLVLLDTRHFANIPCFDTDGAVYRPVIAW